MPTIYIFIPNSEGNTMTNCCRQRKYGLWNLFWDCVFVCITGGFWLIWIFVRESRMRNS